VVAGKVTGRVPAVARLGAVRTHRPTGPWFMTAGQARALARETGSKQARAREPVVRIWPRLGLLGIRPRGADALGKLRELVTAALPDGREWHRVPGEIECDLVRLTGPVAAAHSHHRQHRAIDAT